MTGTRLICLAALLLLPAAASAATDTWEGSGPFATGQGDRVVGALAVSPDGGAVYAGTGSGTVFRYTHAASPVNGACGSDNGLTLTATPANLCTAGSAGAVASGNTSYTWSCNGANGGTNASCSATRNYIVTSSVSGGNGTVSASQTVAYNATPSFTLTPAAGYTSGPVSGICGGSLSGNGYTTNAVTANCTVVAGFTAILPVPLTSYTAPSATGSGNISASFSGGGTGCGYSVSQFIPLSGHPASPPTAPAGFLFPHGLFDFTTSGCTPGATITITITYPAALPAGSVYWKYGPSPAGYNCSGAGCAAPHWYQMPPAQAVFSGNTVTLTIIDGGVGDDDLSANGVIVDQGGPGVPGGAAGVPTLSEWAMILMALLLAGLGARGARRRQLRA